MSAVFLGTANALASTGYRVLIIDMDIQNSLSLHYLESAEVTEEHNIVLALHTGKLESNIIPSNYPGIDIIPSNFNLVGHREKHLIDSSDLPASEL